MCDKISLVLLTGMPGVGKTTITKKLFDALTEKGIQCSGFYTEEVRNKDNGERIGFDVVTLNENERKILARYETSSVFKRPKIGKYSVYVDEFENISIKLLSNFSSSNCKQFLIIDEIGKMELLSKKFEIEIRKLIEKIKKADIKVIATIPNRNQMKIIQDLLKLSNAKLFTITKMNRNQIFNDIEKLCFNIFK